jgi:hypothetical protein
MVSQPLRRPGVVTLATAAFAQTADLVQAEFRLARAELAEKMSAIRSSLIMLSLGAAGGPPCSALCCSSSGTKG